MNILDKFHNWRRKMRWNKQYKQGRWDSLQSKQEASRYYTIADFIKKHGPASPSILDLGCGDGVLNERMESNSYSHFTGVDFAAESIKRAKQKNIPNTTFLTADLHTYTPQGNFDIIVFNEAFYYVHNTVKQTVLNKALKALKPNGILIVSIYREGTGCWEYFNDNTNLNQLEFLTVTTNEKLRYWKIGVYQLNN